MISAGERRSDGGDLVPRTASTPVVGDLVPDGPGPVVAAVPAPRPEVLARVLAGLRDLPDQPARPVPAAPRHDEGADDALADGVRVPLPRRRG